MAVSHYKLLKLNSAADSKPVVQGSRFTLIICLGVSTQTYIQTNHK